MHARLLLWTGEASQIIGDLADQIVPVLNNTDKDRADWVVRQLFMMAHTSSEGLLFLIRVERGWSAEMIVRSVAESTSKLAFIELANESVRVNRAEDFWEVGLDLAALADDRRIREFFDSFSDGSNDPMWRPHREMLLPDERRAELETKYPSKSRRDHSHHWSFRQLNKP
jgi:hypothetical protein